MLFSSTAGETPINEEKRLLRVKMLYEMLRKRLSYLDSAIAFFTKKAKEVPNGILKAEWYQNKDGGYFQYFWRERKANGAIRYLKKEEIGFARQLAQKEYYEKALKVAEREKALLDRFLDHSDENALLKVYTEMSEGKRILVEPYVLTDDEFARRWQAKPFTGGRFGDDDPVYYTKRGDRVRSKSEQIIADRLFDAGVPYRYEYPFVYESIEGKKQIFTDFTALNKRTRSVYRWEHFGRMDDPKYRRTFFWKQSIYSQNDCIPGVGIIFTFEDNDNPLDARYVDKIIEKYFK